MYVDAVRKSHESHLETVRNKCLRTSMVKNLLKIMSEAVNVSGVEGCKRQKVATSVCESNTPAMARFALGADDGAYLRSNVMPLHTVLDQNDERLSVKLTVDMEITSACGLLDAYSSVYSKRLDAKSESLKAVWQTACWIISIAEVGEFVKQYFQQQHINCDTARILTLCDLMQSGDQMPLMDIATLVAFTDIFRALMAPMNNSLQSLIRSQFEEKPSEEHTKIKQAIVTVFQDALNQPRQPRQPAQPAVPAQRGFLPRFFTAQPPQPPAQPPPPAQPQPPPAQPQPPQPQPQPPPAQPPPAQPPLQPPQPPQPPPQPPPPPPPFSPIDYADDLSISADDDERNAWNAAFHQILNRDQANQQRNVTTRELHAILDLNKLEDVVLDSVDSLSPYMIDANDDNVRKIGFALARGLCGRRAAHHRPSRNPDDDDGLFYNTPVAACPTMSQISDILCEKLDDTPDTGVIIYGPFQNIAREDFCNFEKQYTSVPTKWTPIKSDYGLDDSNEAILLTECSIMEHLVRYYKAKGGTDGELLRNLAHAAAAKLFQVPFLAKLYSTNSTRLRSLCPSNGFRTVALQTSSACAVQYAFNAGVVQLTKIQEKEATPVSTDASILTKDLRRDLTATLQRNTTTTASDVACMYLSTPLDYASLDQEKTNVGTIGSAPSFPKQAAHIQALEVKNLYALMKKGIALCDKVKEIQTELATTASAKKEISERSQIGMDQLFEARKDRARSRREEVWNDAMREAAISGDRLYAFVRQLSGTIHEQVDSVCVVDESMLVQQQKDKQANAKRLSLLASQQHMQLVSTVFKNVISESGLVLGIDDKMGINGDLKVVSNTLRKQVSELASGNGTDGFFTNSVRLENLMAQGTGEMTLSTLFQRLRDVGMDMQQAALDDSQDGLVNDSPSLEYLSSPRNSLLLRYKPEAHAAIRQAYDTFNREMQTRHHSRGYYPHRKISAFELIEGRHDELCMAFATFAAHTLAHQRMFSAAHAAYLGQFASRANIAAMHFTLDKLIGVACRYLADTECPDFTSDDGWKRYFGAER